MRKLFCILILALTSTLAYAQRPDQIELPCPAGSSPTWMGQSYDQATGKYRQWQCVKQNGTVTQAITDSGNGGQVFNVKAYGAKGDGVIVQDAAITTGTALLTSVTANFTSANAGMTICINGAGTSGAILVSTIQIVNSTTQVTLTDNAATSVTNAVATWGTDDRPAIAAAIAAANGAGGIIYFPNGIYQINSLHQIDTTDYTAIDIPAQTSSGLAADWIFQGESPTMWTGEAASSTIQTNGAILNITQAAVNSAGASNNVIYGTYQENAPASAYPFVQDEFHNLTVRFPSNQRGHEVGFDTYYAGTTIFNGTLQDFNVAYSSLANSATLNRGYATQPGSKGNIVRFNNTYAVGDDVGYYMGAEHIVGDSMTAIYCNYWGQYAVTNTVYHPSEFRNLIDQENIHGLQIIAHNAAGSMLDIFGYDIEQATSGIWNRAAQLAENSPGNSNGFISYEIVSQGSGVQACPASIFTTGGGNFVQQCGGVMTIPASQPTHVIVSALPAPSSANAGRTYWVTDSTTNTHGATITGGGTDAVKAICDGTNWVVEYP